MATIINKTAPTPLIPLANSGGVSIPSSAMAAIESAMANPHIGTNKVNSKKSKKKAKKQQKASNVATHNNAVNIPVHDVEVVEAEIVEPVKEEVVLPEVKTASVIIAHTEEKEATKAALPDERTMGLYKDFEGIKNEILATHKNGAILPEGFAKAVREVADTIDAVEKVDAERRGISIKKEVYGSRYNEPEYDIGRLSLCTHFSDDDCKNGEYIKCFIPLDDFAFINHEFDKSVYSSRGRSLLKIINDNMRFISDREICTTNMGTAVAPISANIARSGYLVFTADTEQKYRGVAPRRFSQFMVEFAVPRSTYFSLIAPKPEVKVCFLNNEVAISRYIDKPKDEVISLVELYHIDADELDDISGLRTIDSHALSFEDIEQLVHDPDVLIDGLHNPFPNIYNMTDGAYPRAVTEDGNVIICTNECV